jgi:hypothetical protein
MVDNCYPVAFLGGQRFDLGQAPQFTFLAALMCHAICHHYDG